MIPWRKAFTTVSPHFMQEYYTVIRAITQVNNIVKSEPRCPERTLPSRAGEEWRRNQVKQERPDLLSPLIFPGPGVQFMPFVVMEDLLDKLKLLDYEVEFVSELRMRPLNRLVIGVSCCTQLQ